MLTLAPGTAMVPPAGPTVLAAPANAEAQLPHKYTNP